MGRTLMLLLLVTATLIESKTSYDEIPCHGFWNVEQSMVKNCLCSLNENEATRNENAQKTNFFLLYKTKMLGYPSPLLFFNYKT